MIFQVVKGVVTCATSFGAGYIVTPKVMELIPESAAIGYKIVGTLGAMGIVGAIGTAASNAVGEVVEVFNPKRWKGELNEEEA